MKVNLKPAVLNGETINQMAEFHSCTRQYIHQKLKKQQLIDLYHVVQQNKRKEASAKHCQFCNTIFYNKNDKFCSRKCDSLDRSHKAKVAYEQSVSKKVCQYQGCKKLFLPNRRNGSPNYVAKYCSQECYLNAVRKNVST